MVITGRCEYPSNAQTGIFIQFYWQGVGGGEERVREGTSQGAVQRHRVERTEGDAKQCKKIKK